MPADIPFMPIYGRHFEPGQLQFITTSTYRRSRLFTCQRFCWIFVETLRQVRQGTGFLLIGFGIRLSERFLRLEHEPPGLANLNCGYSFDLIQICRGECQCLASGQYSPEEPTLKQHAILK